MARNRISVSFSKKYEHEYDLLLKEPNASELICELLRKHYEGDVTNRDIMKRIEELIKNNNIKDYDKDLNAALDAWD